MPQGPEVCDLGAANSDSAYDATAWKKTELARQMLDVLMLWTSRRIDAAADSAYCNDTITRGLRRRVHLFGAMRPDAVLTALPTKTKSGSRGGRPSKRGKLLQKPEAVAADRRRPWQTCEVFVYGRKQTIRFKTFTAQWHRACGTRLLRIVIVATDRGAVPFRVFFSTDASLNVSEIIAGYGLAGPSSASSAMPRALTTPLLASPTPSCVSRPSSGCSTRPHKGETRVRCFRANQLITLFAPATRFAIPSRRNDKRNKESDFRSAGPFGCAGGCAIRGAG